MRRELKVAAVVMGGCLVVGVAESVQVYLGAQGMGRPVSWSRAFTACMPSWLVVGLFTPGVLWLSRHHPLAPGRRWRAFAIHVPAAIVYALATIMLASWLSDYVFYREMPIGYWVNLSRLLGLYMVLYLIFYAATVALHSAVVWRAALREREREAAELALRTANLETSLAHAHLETLRMQLNPHFLFNALNTVSVLAMKGERERVVRTLMVLSDLLRLSLDRSDPLVSLHDELGFLDRYLEIEQIRFGDRLMLRRDVAPEALEAEVPSLLLQPLFENAVRHGLSRQPGPGRIELRIRRVDDALHIDVVDNGPGFGDGGAREGVGLGNTRARLAQLYGADHRLTLGNDSGGGAHVHIRIPFRLAEDTVAWTEKARSA